MNISAYEVKNCKNWPQCSPDPWATMLIRTSPGLSNVQSLKLDDLLLTTRNHPACIWCLKCRWYGISIPISSDVETGWTLRSSHSNLRKGLFPEAVHVEMTNCRHSLCVGGFISPDLSFSMPSNPSLSTWFYSSDPRVFNLQRDESAWTSSSYC